MLPLLAKARARSAPERIRSTVQAALLARWWAVLSVTAQRCVAGSLGGQASSLHFPADEVPSWGEIAGGPLEPPVPSRLPAR